MPDLILPMTGEGNRSQTAVMVVGASATTHRLQMESLIPTPPQVDSTGCVMRSRTHLTSELHGLDF